MHESILPHRNWALLLGIMLIIALGSPFFSTYMYDHFETRKKELINKRDLLAKQFKQWQEDRKTAFEINKTISKEEIGNLLAPTDKDVVAAQIETLGAKARLKRLHYIFSPPKPWDGEKDFPGILKVGQRTLVIEADAPHDGYIYSFLENMDTVGGKMRLQKLSITSLGNFDKNNPSAYNLHVSVTYQWLYNEGME